MPRWKPPGRTLVAPHEAAGSAEPANHLLAFVLDNERQTVRAAVGTAILIRQTEGEGGVEACRHRLLLLVPDGARLKLHGVGEPHDLRAPVRVLHQYEILGDSEIRKLELAARGRAEAEQPGSSYTLHHQLIVRDHTPGRNGPIEPVRRSRTWTPSTAPAASQDHTSESDPGRIRPPEARR
jgi:hypothetical protein